MQSEDFHSGTVTPEPLLLVTRLMLMEDREREGQKERREGKGREHERKREGARWEMERGSISGLED